ncbi:hypothetical protein HDV00_009124 [Rhizophlyctis rosea]|nr:hypothetical protein HDV00_009124 [Rhizophlyctis rosea]
MLLQALVAASVLALPLVSAAPRPLRDRISPIDVSSILYSRHHLARRDQANATVPVSIYGGGDILNTVTVQLGTPAQSIDAVIDSGSSFLWVPGNSATCSGCNTTLNKFNENASSTFQSQNQTGVKTEIYGDTTRVEGYIAQDTLTLGGITVSNFTFMNVFNYTVPPSVLPEFGASQYPGIIGMSPPVNSSSPPEFQKTVPIGTTTAAQLWNKGITSFGLLPATNTTKGSLILDGTYPSEVNENSFQWVQLVGSAEHPEVNSTWAAQFDGFSLAGSQPATKKGVVLLDTGSRAGQLSPDFVTSVGKLLNLTLIPDPNASNSTSSNTSSPFPVLYSTDCSSISSLPSLYMNLNGISLPLAPEHYIMQVAGYCVFGAFGTTSLNGTGFDGIIGMNFLRGYFSQWDWEKKRVGFANLTSNGGAKSNGTNTGSQGGANSAAVGVRVGKEIGGFVVVFALCMYMLL